MVLAPNALEEAVLSITIASFLAGFLIVFITMAKVIYRVGALRPGELDRRPGWSAELLRGDRIFTRLLVGDEFHRDRRRIFQSTIVCVLAMAVMVIMIGVVGHRI